MCDRWIVIFLLMISLLIKVFTLYKMYFIRLFVLVYEKQSECGIETINNSSFCANKHAHIYTQIYFCASVALWFLFSILFLSSDPIRFLFILRTRIDSVRASKQVFSVVIFNRSIHYTGHNFIEGHLHLLIICPRFHWRKKEKKTAIFAQEWLPRMERRRDEKNN